MNRDAVISDVNLVLAGHAGFAAIRFPRDPRAFDILVRHAHAFITLHALTLRPEQRRAYIRKLALYIVRRGMSPHPEFDLLIGSQWFSARPEALQSRMSFAHAIRLQRESYVRDDVPAKPPARPTSLQDAMDAPMCPAPELFRDGDTFLVEIVHPRQMMLTGIAARNCLARHLNGTPYPNIDYWARIAKGYLHIYALWRATDLLAVLSAGNGELQEWEYVAPVRDVAPFILRTLEAVETRLAPIEMRCPAIIADRSFFHEDDDPPVVAYRHATRRKYYGSL